MDRRHKRRALSILIALCLTFAVTPGMAFAAGEVSQGEVEPQIKEELQIKETPQAEEEPRTEEMPQEEELKIEEAPQEEPEAGEAPQAGETTEFHVNIVHTNDIHARILEDDGNQVIGLSKVKTYIKQASVGKDLSLALDGGDTFHGQSIATIVKGESAARVLGACGYDAVAAGNHDWNYGKDRLKELESIVRQNGSPEFSILAGNVVREDGSSFFERPYLIKSVEKDGKTLKIGVFGVIDPAIYDATAPGNVEGLKFTDMTVFAQKAAEELKNQGCQIVAGLAHCISPKGLAASVNGVDLWLAGHEHVSIHDMVTRPDGKKALVVETGYNLWNFGNVEISCTLDAGGNLAGDITMAENLVDYETGKALEPDQNVQSLLDAIQKEQEGELSKEAGYAPEDLDGVWEHTRIGETTMGRAVTDAYLLATGADIAFENAGGIRASIQKGKVSYKNVLDVSPYGNYIVTKRLSGKEILEILETSLEIMKANIEANEKGDYDGWPGNSGNTLQAGGIEVRYNLSREKGSRILSALVDGKDVQESQSYIVAMNNYLPRANDYPQLNDKANIHEYQACEDALAAYLSQSEDVVRESLGRARLTAADDGKPGQADGDNQEGSEPKPAAPQPADMKRTETKPGSVQTGDGWMVELYLLLAAAGGGTAVVILRRKCRKSA